MSARAPFLLAIALCATGAEAFAQLRTHAGEGTSHWLGFSVDGVGDVNGDGIPDYAVGGPRTSLFGCGWDDSTVDVFSGIDGALLHRFALDVGEHHGAIVRAAGDVDGDGFADILVANSPDFDCAGDPSAYVWSGASGAQLYWIPVGEWWELYDYQVDKSIDGGGDVDGDGRDDFVLGERDYGIAWGAARVYSGRNGALLYEEIGVQDFEFRGRHVGMVGDWNSDGLDDVAISSNVLGTRVVSVATGATVFQVGGVGAIDDPGDFDGNGTRDLLIGNRIVSGSDGSVIINLSWPVVRVATDFDQDGWLDFVASDPAWNGKRGRAAILSGADASVMSIVFEGQEPNEYGGHEVAYVGDTNGDGVGEVVVGAPFHGSQGRGRALLLTGWCAPAPGNYCVGATNSTGVGAKISHEGTWSVSSALLRLVATDCPTHHFGLFFYSATQAQKPFGNGWLCLAPSLYRLWPPAGTGSTGTAVKQLDFDAPPLGSGPGQVTPGSTWHFQFWYRDVPAGGAMFNLTDGLSVTFCL